MNQPPLAVRAPLSRSRPDSDLRKIAAAQKLLLWSLLAILPIFFVPYLALLAWVFQIWAVCNMGAALKLPNLWLWVIGTMIPLLGIFVLLRMNAKVNTTLQSAGIRVGLMGANMKDLNP